MDARIIGAPKPRYYAVKVPGTAPAMYDIRDGVYDGENHLQATICCVGAGAAETVVEALNLLDSVRSGSTSAYPTSLVVSAAIRSASQHC